MDDVPAITNPLVSRLVQDHLIQDSLQTLAYIPDYITEDEERRLLREVHGSRAKWTQLSGRRLQNHGGVVHPKGLLQSRLPAWLDPLMARLHGDTHVFGDAPPNHVLVNAYRPGEGIMPHEDGPSYWPGVCILSLGAPAVIRFWRKRPDQGSPSADTAPDASLLLMPRSLLVFAGEAYTHCLHGIQQVQEELLDASVLNLTCHPEVIPGAQQPCTSRADATRAHQPQARLIEAAEMIQPPNTAAQSSTCHQRHAAQPPFCHHDSDPSSATQPPKCNGEVVHAYQPPMSNTEVAAHVLGTSHQQGRLLPRGGERISLTVRRVTKVVKSLVRLAAT